MPTPRENILLDMAHPLPPPGPDHYAARRARWLASDAPAAPRPVPRPVVRLRALLDSPDVHTDPVWSRGVASVWNGLARGYRPAHPLPLPLVIKIIHAAWRRDPETWPDGAVVPASDEPPTAPGPAENEP